MHLKFLSFGFGQIRTIEDGEGKTWFNIHEVCYALGLDRHWVRTTLGKAEREKFLITDSQGLGTVLDCMSTEGLCKVCLCSERPIAKAFYQWAVKGPKLLSPLEVKSCGTLKKSNSYGKNNLD